MGQSMDIPLSLEQPRAENPIAEDGAAEVGALLRQRERDEARSLALNLLARREHGRAELEAKLIAKGFSAGLAAELLRDLREEGLQSDQRFAAALVRRRIDRGYGPAYIRQELQGRQVDEGLVEAELGRPDNYWQEVAQHALAKKFPARFAALPSVSLEGERCDEERPSEGDAAYPAQARFLARRGFPADLVYRLLRQKQPVPDDIPE